MTRSWIDAPDGICYQFSRAVSNEGHLPPTTNPYRLASVELMTEPSDWEKLISSYERATVRHEVLDRGKIDPAIRIALF